MARITPASAATQVSVFVLLALLNRPGFELTPISWTNFKRFYGKVQNRVQAQSRKELLASDGGAKLLESVRQMKHGNGVMMYSPVIAARQNSQLPQSQFTLLLGVSVRTLQGWEQGRKQPSGAARTLITSRSATLKR